MKTKVDLFVLVEMSAPALRVRRWGRIQIEEAELSHVAERLAAFQNVLFICKGRPPHGEVLYDRDNRAPVLLIARWTDLTDLNQVIPSYPKNMSFLPWVLKKDTFVYIGHGLDLFHNLGEVNGYTTKVRLKASSNEAKDVVLEVMVRGKDKQTSLKLNNLKDAFRVAEFVQASLNLPPETPAMPSGGLSM